MPIADLLGFILFVVPVLMVAVIVLAVTGSLKLVLGFFRGGRR